MKLLTILPDLGIGGAERAVVNLLVGLAERGIHSTLITLFDPRPNHYLSALNASGITVTGLGKHIGPDIHCALRLRRVLRRAQPDVIHTHRYALRYLMLTLPSRARLRSVIHTVNNIATEEVRPASQPLYRAAFRMGVLPVAVSTTVRQTVCARYGLPVDRVPVIPNPVAVPSELPPRAPSCDEYRVLAIGRLAPQKNYPCLLRAVDIAGPRLDRPLRLQILGDGPLRSELVQLARGIRHARVEWVGVVSEVSPYLQRADVFAMSSNYEGLPLAVLEAMAAGVPVVATSVGGIPDLLQHGTEGTLVPPKDSEALADAIVAALTQRDSAARRATKAFDRLARECDIDVIVSQYTTIYERAKARA